MRKVEIGSTRFTQIIAVDEPGSGGANHLYEIKSSEADTDRVFHHPLAQIKFQEGPVPEAGLNGVFMEDLIAICIDRLKGFQQGKLACKFNENAIEHLDLALEFLNIRTRDRQERGVEGTNQR